jgi:hypothetical protein
MGTLMSFYLRNEYKWDVGDCLFAGIIWPFFLLYAYWKYDS